MTSIGDALGPWTYLTFIVVWAAPVWIVQLLVGGPDLWARRRDLVVGTIVPTIYLSIADAFAIAQGIWRISPDRTIGLRVGPLPLEEALFFLVTNSFIVGLLILAHGPVARCRANRLLRALSRPWAAASRR